MSSEDKVGLLKKVSFDQRFYRSFRVASKKTIALWHFTVKLQELHKASATAEDELVQIGCLKPRNDIVSF